MKKSKITRDKIPKELLDKILLQKGQIRADSYKDPNAKIVAKITLITNGVVRKFKGDDIVYMELRDPKNKDIILKIGEKQF